MLSNNRKLLLFFLQWLTIFCLQASSRRREWDGVVITQDDYQGLQAFKNDLIDPNGYLKSWNDSGLGACSGGWVGIKCAKGQVIAIQLAWKGLGGRITEKIIQFQTLRKLNLHDNLIGGMIPSSLGLLPHLRGVNLFNNRFSGSIPPSLGLCSLLQTLDLSNNSLSGTIPPSLGNSSKLYRLNLSHNSLVGPVPGELARLEELTFLDLHHNNLSGTLPLDLPMLSTLMTLDLSHNFINGTIPSTISRLYSLNILNLENNNLIGQLPLDIGNLPNLSVLNLRKNQMKGFIPLSIGNISTLTILDLSCNNLNGEIPDSLSHLPKLTSFNVSYNNLSQSVPIRLSQKFNSSSFIGNLKLCGFSLSTPCYLQPPSPQRSRKITAKDIVLIAVATLLIVMFSLCCILFRFLSRRRAARKRRGPPSEKGVPQPEAIEAEAEDGGGKLVHFDGPFVFNADDLLCGTAEIMGKDTYGTSYKTTLEDGNQVAVKRMREKITKGQKEFEAEVHLIAKIRHPNLLALRAYYLGPKGEKLLVFDYMPKGSLATFLHAREPGKQINWETRMRIIKGTTRGLFHLHNNMNMIHGNLTSTNVLIDHNNDAIISDYALSRLTITTTTTTSTNVLGAVGYRAPELSKIKKNNTKTDVYALGVIMLELLTGKSPEKAINGLDLPRWAASVVKEEWTNEVFDEELMKEASLSVVGDEELISVLKLALHCVHHLPSLRPEVLQVVQQLEEIIMPSYCSSED